MDKSLQLHIEALENANKIGSLQEEAASYGSIGHVYYLLKDYENAIYYLKLALCKSRKLKRLASVIINIKLLIKVYTDIGDDRRAYYFKRVLNRFNN